MRLSENEKFVKIEIWVVLRGGIMPICLGDRIHPLSTIKSTALNDRQPAGTPAPPMGLEAGIIRGWLDSPAAFESPESDASKPEALPTAVGGTAFCCHSETSRDPFIHLQRQRCQP